MQRPSISACPQQSASFLFAFIPTFSTRLVWPAVLSLWICHYSFFILFPVTLHSPLLVFSTAVTFSLFLSHLHPDHSSLSLLCMCCLWGRGDVLICVAIDPLGDIWRGMCVMTWTCFCVASSAKPQPSQLHARLSDGRTTYAGTNSDLHLRLFSQCLSAGYMHTAEHYIHMPTYRPRVWPCKAPLRPQMKELN